MVLVDIASSTEQNKQCRHRGSYSENGAIIVDRIYKTKECKKENNCRRNERSD